MTGINLNKTGVFKTKIGRIVFLVLVSMGHLVNGRPIDLVPFAAQSELGSASILGPATEQATVKYDPALQDLLDCPKEAQLLAKKNKSFDEKMYMPNGDEKEKFDKPGMKLRKLLGDDSEDDSKGGGGRPGWVTLLWLFCIVAVFVRYHIDQGGQGGGHQGQRFQGGNGGW